MTLQKIVTMLKTAPASEIDADVAKTINEVDVEDEAAVRQMMEKVYKAGFYGKVTPFVATLVAPEFTKNYPLK
jgi:hypothetical protein